MNFQNYCKKIIPLLCALISLPAILGGCASVRLNFLVDKTDPLEQSVLQGRNRDSKILLLNIDGVISSSQGFELFKDSSSIVEETVSQLRLASADRNIKALIIKVDSPGGTTTASDIIYHEIMKYKKATGNKIVVMMMDMATSGGYMVSLPADKIVAQPTTVTGSIGVIFMRPKLQGLLDKIGVSVEVTKSGGYKDMGSPFRNDDKAEEKLFQDIIGDLNGHFYSLIEKHRKISPENLDKIRTARVFVAKEALDVGLVDMIGYPDDAIAACKDIAGLPQDSQVVAYRRIFYPDDNIYNTSQSKAMSSPSLINVGILGQPNSFKAGFYYAWPGVFPSGI